MGRLWIALLLLSPLLMNCSETNSLINEELKHKYDVNKYALNKLICDPWGNEVEDPSLGVTAELFYLQPDQPLYASAQDYIDNGTSPDNYMFLSGINIPTRQFDLGFPITTGGIVENDQGEALYEYFGLRLSTIIKLRPEDEAGEYEFALLSDDGAIWTITQNGQEVELVENDGNHPTRMGCSVTTINMDHNTEIISQIKYYQGPRYHIALVPMWRRIDGNRQSESLCGTQGNSKFFDYQNDSQPQQAYLDLLARGWKTLEAGNFGLPLTSIFNPCVKGDAPEITNFSVMDFLDGQIMVLWNTDILSTSQLRIIDTETGEEIMSVSDNILRTQHEVRFGGLSRGKSYLIQAVSISENLGKSLSDPISIILQ